VTQQERQVNALVQKLSPELARAFREAIRKHAGQIDVKAMVAALEVGDVLGAAEIARIRPATMFQFTEVLRAAFIQGGANAVARGAFSFDGRHPLAEQWFQRRAAALVQGISDESVDVARQVIASQVGTVPSAKIAQEIVGKRLGTGRVGGLVGLTSQMADSILAGREKLKAGRYGDYLALKLRDRRFDRIIRAAMKSGKPLPAAQINAILAGHKQKALTYRGKMIATHETHRALAAGRHESFRQLIESGKADDVSKTWMHGSSADPRHNHLALDGVKVGFNETFDLGLGLAALYPHDETLPASETISCRCIAFYRIEVRL
jgi:hypothetical protein